jgi:phosphohistidine phosphatase
MFIYLVRHAEAKQAEEGPSRPLSEKGIQDINRIAAYVSKLDIRIGKIFHSTKLRAKQTAEILFEYLNPLKGMSEVDGLAPLDDPHIWAERLKDVPGGIVLVGHLPHLARLTSLLLLNDTEKNLLSFEPAGMICLRGGESGTWSLRWMLTPEIVAGEKGTESCDGL